jgi:hypothetical protein
VNKKDVLGAWLAAWNVQKMESMPHGLSAGNAHFPALNRQGQGNGQGKFWRYLKM